MWARFMSLKMARRCVAAGACRCEGRGREVLGGREQSDSQEYGRTGLQVEYMFRTYFFRLANCCQRRMAGAQCFLSVKAPCWCCCSRCCCCCTMYCCCCWFTRSLKKSGSAESSEVFAIERKTYGKQHRSRHKNSDSETKQYQSHD